MNNIFISNCGNYIAIRVPGIQPNFDIWKHDGSELWEGNRYVELPNKKGCYNSRGLYTKQFAKPTKLVDSWSNFGHRIKVGRNKDKYIEEFEVLLHDLVNKESIVVRFKTQAISLSPLFNARRATDSKEKRNA